MILIIVTTFFGVMQSLTVSIVICQEDLPFIARSFSKLRKKNGSVIVMFTNMYMINNFVKFSNYV